MRLLVLYCIYEHHHIRMKETGESYTVE